MSYHAWATEDVGACFGVKRDVRTSMDARCGDERTENGDLNYMEADAGLENEGCQSQQAKEDLLMHVDPSKIDWDSEEETRRNKAIVSKTTAFSDTPGRWNANDAKTYLPQQPV
jgi:hypothetical protein